MTGREIKIGLHRKDETEKNRMMRQLKKIRKKRYKENNNKRKGIQ